MSNALFASMFAQPQPTKKDRKRARRRRMIEGVTKVSIYGGFIASFALSADNPLQYAGVVSSVCVALEFYAKAFR